MKILAVVTFAVFAAIVTPAFAGNGPGGPYGYGWTRASKLNIPRAGLGMKTCTHTIASVTTGCRHSPEAINAENRARDRHRR